MSNKYQSIPGDKVFKSAQNEPVIMLAANTRICKGITQGILEAAKAMNTVVFFELAKSECNLDRGYTGQTPEIFAEHVREAAEVADYPYFIIHGDHNTITKGTPEDVAAIKELIGSQIDNGYTSFAIDASFLFNLDGNNDLEHLEKNIEVTTDVAKFIEGKMGGKGFGLEVEVGEIGKKDEHGLVVTTVGEAITYIKQLDQNDVHPNVLAIANGSAHGNIYDAAGNKIAQVSIDIPRTIEIADAITKYGVKIAQHGITGTPMEFIAKYFPKGKILKGNVGTHWMNIAWDVLKVYETDLFEQIWNWTLDNYRSKMPGKSDQQVFDTFSKFAIGQFYDEIYGVDEDTEEALRAIAYAEALKFMGAFGCKGMAKKVSI